MYETKQQIAIGGIMLLAKEGNTEAQKYLLEQFSLKIYSKQAIQRINQLRDEGLTTEQAIKQLRQEEE